MKLGMWSSEGHCGHQASLELVNTVTNLLAPLAEKEQKLGPELPCLPSSPVYLSLPLLLLLKTYTVKARGNERQKFVLMGTVSSHVLVCLYSPVSCPSFLSNSLPMATSDHQQAWIASQKFLHQIACLLHIISPLFHILMVVPFPYWWLTDR